MLRVMSLLLDVAKATAHAVELECAGDQETGRRGRDQIVAASSSVWVL